MPIIRNARYPEVNAAEENVEKIKILHVTESIFGGNPCVRRPSSEPIIYRSSHTHSISLCLSPTPSVSRVNLLIVIFERLLQSLYYNYRPVFFPKGVPQQLERFFL